MVDSHAPDSAADATSVIIPVGEKLSFKSELFDVVVRRKWRQVGITRDRFFLWVELLENDPLVKRDAVVEVPQDEYRTIGIGERAKARLYEQPNGSWDTAMPLQLPKD